MSLPKQSDKLKLVELSGNYSEMGKQYGSLFATELSGFYYQEIIKNYPNKSDQLAMKRLTTLCLKHIKTKSPDQLKFLKGVCETSNLNLNEVVHLSLHEELVHTQHCTALNAYPYIAQKLGLGALTLPLARFYKNETQ